MKILRKELTLKQFEDYVKKYNFGTLPPNSIIFHHTYRPTLKTWQGLKGLDNLKKVYEGYGWSAGPHLFISEDKIYLFTPMNEVGIHAGPGNATWKNKKTNRLSHQYRNDFVNYDLIKYSIGIEVIGDYQNKQWSEKTKAIVAGASKVLQDRLNIEEKDLYCHRQFSVTACPGNAISLSWIKKVVKEYGGTSPQVTEPKTVAQKTDSSYKMASDLEKTLEEFLFKEYVVSTKEGQLSMNKDLNLKIDAIDVAFKALKEERAELKATVEQLQEKGKTTQRSITDFLRDLLR